MAFDFKKLVKYIVDDGDRFTIVRPGITLTFYFAEAWRKTVPLVPTVLELFRQFIPKDALKSYYGHDGTYRKLTSTKITRDMELFTNLPKTYRGQFVEYTSGEDGDVGEYAFRFKAFDWGADLDREVDFLRLEFPPSFGEEGTIDEFKEFALAVAQMLPFQSGNAGFAFHHSRAYENAGYNEVFRMLPRYLGFDSSYDSLCNKMRDCSPPVHWLNFLDNKLLERLGGVATMRAAGPEIEITVTERGIMMCSARLPPVGDVNRRAPDLGLLPITARLLRPLRSDIEVFESDTVEFNAQAWLGRLDDVLPLNWDNAG